MAEKRNQIIDYTKILSRVMRQNPVWRGLAEATREVLSKEVDDRRRKLEKVRDSVKFRRGDELIDIKYEDNGEPLIYAGTQNAATLPTGTKITRAKILDVVSGKHSNTSDHDYISIEFEQGNHTYNWRLPLSAPQERDVLLQNAKIMGFDFFNTKISDEELERLYHFIQQFWNDGPASDNFIKFISFVKNIDLTGVPLWSYDDGTNNYPVLQEKKPENIPAYEGGTWYLTNHVELQLDLTTYKNNYSEIVLNDLEDLFYYFAPIILVLERIIANIDFPIVEIPIVSSGTNQVVFSAADRYKFNTLIEINVISSGTSGIAFYAINRIEIEPPKSYTPLTSNGIVLKGKDSNEIYLNLLGIF